MINLATLFAAVLILFIGATVQGSVGMGLGLIATPFLLLLEPRLIPGPFIFAGAFLTLMMVLRDPAAVDFSGFKPFLVGYVPGAFLAARLLVTVPEAKLVLAFGLVVLVAVLLSLVGWRLKPGPAVLLGVGVLTGLIGTITGMAGPPMAILYQYERGARLRGTLAGFFLLMALVSLVILALVGYFGWQQVLLALPLLPAMAGGFLLSNRLTPFLDRGHTRPAILATSLVTVLVVIIRQLV